MPFKDAQAPLLDILENICGPKHSLRVLILKHLHRSRFTLMR